MSRPVDHPEGGGRPRCSRRTRRRLLDEVEREVEAMSLLGIKGPTSLLRDRLAERGVTTTLETLRSGDCRPLLERVWRRRSASRIVYGPTHGHDMRKHSHLVDDIIDLRAKVARVRADLAGQQMEPAKRPERDPRSAAVCRRHAAHVASMAALIATTVVDLGRKSVYPDFVSVSKALSTLGTPLSVRSIQRREEYWRPILEYHDIHRPRKPNDHARGPLSGFCRERLGAMVVQLQAELAMVNAQFEATLT